MRSYVVDSADPEALEQSRHELHELLSKPSLAGIPVLVLGNKNDVDGALKELELIEQMYAFMSWHLLAPTPLILCCWQAITRAAGPRALLLQVGQRFLL